MPLLHPGDTFPAFDVKLVGSDSLTLPQVMAGGFGVVLFNRGSWCPYCNAQLRGFQRVTADLDDLGATVVSLSVDDEATATQMVTSTS